MCAHTHFVKAKRMIAQGVFLLDTKKNTHAQTDNAYALVELGCNTHKLAGLGPLLTALFDLNLFVYSYGHLDLTLDQ